MKNKRNEIVINLLKVNAYLVRVGNQITNKHNLNQQQFTILKHIQHHQPINQNHICSSLVFEKSSVSKITKRLHELKLVNIKQSQTDKRSSELFCTKQGDKIIEKVMTEYNKFNANFLEELSELELQTILLATDYMAKSINGK